MATFSLILRLDKVKKNGTAPIYFLIINNRKKTKISSSIYINPKCWDNTKLKVKPNCENSVRINSFLNQKLVEIQNSIIDTNSKIKSTTTQQIRDNLYGKKSKDFFSYANEVTESYLKKGLIGTYDKNRSIMKKFKTFAKTNIDFEDITVEYITKYEKYLRYDLKNKTNTIHNDLKYIKKIFNDAFKEDIIDISKNPFLKYKLKKEKSDRFYLTEEELNLIENFKCNEGTRLALHRDMFVFSSYVGGLRISDMLQLQWKHFDGININFKIKKTNNQLSIKVPNKGLEILEKYRSVDSNKNDFIFDMLPNNINLNDPRAVDSAISSSTAYVNKNLKIIANKIELEKPISFHISRHTWATRALRKGISIDKVSKLMGHSAIKETQIYAKIIDTELDKAMEIFNN
jgi:integrase/recombinase XerD